MQRTESQGGGIRTLIHELIHSPLFTGEVTTIERHAGLPESKNTLLDANNLTARMMMTATFADITSPAITKAEPAAAVMPAPEFAFDNESSVQIHVRGLFMPERSDGFRKLIDQFPEAWLLELDYETAAATIAYAGESELFRGAKTEKIIERLNNRVRQLSDQTLGVYRILTLIDGVEQATASFHDGLAIAWIDPEKTNREALEMALKGRGVQLRLP